MWMQINPHCPLELHVVCLIMCATHRELYPCTLCVYILLLEYIHTEYNALTEQVITHVSIEKRTFISREKDTYGRHSIKKYHSFPLSYPMHKHGNKYFLSKSTKFTLDTVKKTIYISLTNYQ